MMPITPSRSSCETATLTSSAPILTAALLVALSSAAPARAQASPPDDAGCAGVIEHWPAFATEENQGGHMDTSVFDAIQTDIDRASASCQAGHAAEALRLVAASKRRHGY
jgi:hypothetical protein